MDYQYDYNLNLNNLTINPTGKPNTVIHPNSYNLNNLNVNSSLNSNSNSNMSTNFTLTTNSNNINKDYYRDDAYSSKNLGSIPYSKGILMSVKNFISENKHKLKLKARLLFLIFLPQLI